MKFSTENWMGRALTSPRTVAIVRTCLACWQKYVQHRGDGAVCQPCLERQRRTPPPKDAA